MKAKITNEETARTYTDSANMIPPTGGSAVINNAQAMQSKIFEYDQKRDEQKMREASVATALTILQVYSGAHSTVQDVISTADEVFKYIKDGK